MSCRGGRWRHAGRDDGCWWLLCALVGVGGDGIGRGVGASGAVGSLGTGDGPGELVSEVDPWTARDLQQHLVIRTVTVLKPGGGDCHWRHESVATVVTEAGALGPGRATYWPASHSRRNPAYPHF